MYPTREELFTTLLLNPETDCVAVTRHSAHTTSHCQRTNDRICISNYHSSMNASYSPVITLWVLTDLKWKRNLVTLPKKQVLHAYGCHTIQNGRSGNSEIREVTQTMHFHTALALFMGIMHNLDKMYIPGGARLSWQQRRSSRKSKTGSTSSWRFSDKLEWGQNFAKLKRRASRGNTRNRCIWRAWQIQSTNFVGEFRIHVLRCSVRG